MTCYTNDAESWVQAYLEKTYNRTVFKTHNFHPMDFYLTEDNTANGPRMYYCEVKGRRNRHDTFPDTLVGTNKVDFIHNLEPEIKVEFYFVFDNQVMVTEYERDRFFSYSERNIYKRKHTVIPVSHLRVIEVLKNPIYVQPSSVRKLAYGPYD